MSRPSPRHLASIAGHLALIAFAAYATAQVFDLGSTNRLNFVLWLLVGAVLHDAVFLPFYTLTDLFGRLFLGENPSRRLALANHVRFPAVISAVLFLVYFPSILNRADANFERVAGRGQASDPLEAWLLITAALFVVSGVVFAVRVVRGRGDAESKPATSA